MTQSYEHAAAFVQALTGSLDTILNFRAVHDTDKAVPGYNRTGTLAQMWSELCKLNNEGRGIFIVVNRSDGQGVDNQNITAARAQWIDLDDVSQAAARLQQAEAWAIKPHFKVMSSPGKFHVYWMVEPYVPGDFFGDMQRRLISLFNSDHRIFDLSRIMRMPGFYHLKNPAEPHLVTIAASTGWGAPAYPPTQLQGALADVMPVQGGGGGDRSNLGDPKLAAPSIEWLKAALDRLDPNTMHRDEWIRTLAAFKQAGWGFGEAVIRPIWDQWCAQYARNDLGENAKQWNDIVSTKAGWPALLKASNLLAQQMFGNTPGQMPTPPQDGVPMVPGQPAPPLPQGSPINGNQLGSFLTPPEQAIYFKGCFYIEKAGVILTPSGRFMNPGNFNAAFGGKQFVIKDDGNGATTDEPWKAATRGQLFQVPKVDHIRFLPAMEPGAISVDELGRKGVNTWIIPNIETRTGDPSPFINHLRKILPTEHDVQILINFFARIVQTPGKKIPWAPVIQSAEGVGKNVIKFCMSHAMGTVYTYYPKALELAETGGKFNAWMRSKTFILCDEVKTDDKRNLIEALKDMVSEKIIQIQGKGADQDIEDNPANWCFFTNWEDAIPIDRKSRRWAIFYSKLQTEMDILAAGMDGKYFNDLYEWIEEQGGKQIVAHFLKNFAIDPMLDPAINQRAPKTSSFEAAIVASRTAPEAAIVQAVEQQRPGFRAGWISSAAVQLTLKGADIKVSHLAIGRILKAMGYHQIGRAQRAYMQEGSVQPNLWALSTEAQVAFYGRAQGYE